VGVNHDHTGVRKRRQDLEPEFRETGAVYAFGAADFLARGNRFVGRIEAVESESIPFDLDDFEDLLQANETAGPFRAFSPVGIKLLVTDFDGVHTDGKVTVSQDGVESVRCSRRDGLGVGLAKQRGLKVLILSKEKNPVVLRRAEKLGVECIHGCDHKLRALESWIRNAGLHWDEVAYLGDDVNDLECLQVAGLACCPSDAVPMVKRAADLVLQARGGDGCVREMIDFITTNH
jgi:N-acylneuraminate cytidylyltransferase